MPIPALRISSSLASLALLVGLAGAPRRGAAAPSGDAAAAANAYEQGQRAELSRDHLRAAEMFELADSILPSPEALRAAIKNYQMAGRNDRAASLAWALGRRYDDTKSQELSEQMLDELTDKLLTVDVECSTPCTVSSEGRALSHVPSTEHKVFLPPGSHDLDVVFGKDLVRREQVEGSASDVTTLSVERPPEEPEPEPEPAKSEGVSASVDGPQTDVAPRRARLSPAWFIVSAAATAGVGGALVWSGMDVNAINGRYEADPTRARLNNGQDAERRTNALIGATAGLAVVTVVLAAVTDWGRWRRNDRQANSPTVRPIVWMGRPGAGFGGRF